VKVQLRNPLSLRCRRRWSSGRQHPGATEIAMGDPGSPESLAQGMFPKGFPINPGELPISSHTERNASHIGRYGTPRDDRRGCGEMASSLTTP
jgi:hypothetical protein